ncbi:peptidoglycan-binding domain-containing protein [Microbacterium deminutum]|uniref:Peptidoglycan-binding protein n=1 Tax=Microbacterium deminutum TaxID=344164 RepID=A0ABN2QX80_9MICO
MNVKPWSTVRQGVDNSVVTGIQYLLRARGHAVAADGQFGPATAAAVRAFQTGAGLTADAVVGPQTWEALVVTTHSGSTGDAVRAVQQFGLVSSPGLPPLVVDGSYGPLTAERVSELQRQWGLTIDGQAGPETWSFLSTFLPGPRPWGLVKQGARQADNWRVLAAQYLLRAHGSGIVADGVFGPASGAAVEAFQRTLRATEISTTLGQLDWPRLIITVRRGDHGDAVRALQTLLTDLAVDGDFGPLTETKVRDFQGVFLPPADGIVGPITWQALTSPIFD